MEINIWQLNMPSKKDQVCLSNLYEDQDVRNTVWTILSEDFEASFERLIKEGQVLRSRMVPIFEENRERIKEMFIEYGYKMVTLMDLKKILDNLPRYCESENSPTDE